MNDINELKDTELENVTGGAVPIAVADGGENFEIKYSIILTGIGARRFDVIKAVNDILSCGYQQAKSVVESIPVPICEGITKDDADRICSKLCSAGAIYEMKQEQ